MDHTSPTIATDAVGARVDVARATNYLIARIAEVMRDEGESSGAITIMRHDLVQAVTTYIPDTFLRRSA